MYDEWLANGVHQYTEAGSMKPAPRNIVVQWNLKAWQMIKKDLIIESFQECGVNFMTDGSEDGKIPRSIVLRKINRAAPMAPARGARGQGARGAVPPMLKKKTLVILPNSMRQLRGVGYPSQM